MGMKPKSRGSKDKRPIYQSPKNMPPPVRITCFRRIRYRLYIVWLASKWIFKTNLGDKVWYRGKKYTVANGSRNGCWRLHLLKDDNFGWVPRKECSKVLSIGNLLRGFKSGHWFYMTNWYDIWLRGGIQPWMRKCNIWGWRK